MDSQTERFAVNGDESGVNLSGGGGPNATVGSSKPRARGSKPPAEPKPGSERRPESSHDVEDDRVVKSIVEKLTKRAKAKSVSAPFDPETAETCPLFWELVTLDRYDAEKDRLLPELTLTRVEGGWECVIRDIETGQETRFGFEAFSELARAAERHLSSPKGIWKPFKNRKNMKGIERHDKKKS